MIQDKKTLRKTDIAFGAFLIILSIFTFVLAYRMPVKTTGLIFSGQDFATAPGLLPMVISAILLLLGVILLVSAVREGARISRDDIRKVIARMKSPESGRMALICLIIIVYSFGLLKRIHFLAATFIYLAVFMFLFKAAHPAKIFILSVVTAGLIWFFFGKLAMIPLP